MIAKFWQENRVNTVPFPYAATGRYWTQGLGPSCLNGELYGFSRPLLQLIRPILDTPVRWCRHNAFVLIHLFAMISSASLFARLCSGTGTSRVCSTSPHRYRQCRKKGSHVRPCDTDLAPSVQNKRTLMWRLFSGKILFHGAWDSRKTSWLVVWSLRQSLATRTG